MNKWSSMSKEGVITLFLLCLLVFLSTSLVSITEAQTRQYHLGQEWVKIWINQNGTIDLFYNISITLDSGSNINYVLVGQPNGDFTIQNATDQYDNMLSTSDASSGSDYKVRVNLASPLIAGQTVWFTVTTNVAHNVYEENQTNVGLQFTPVWWLEATVADLRVSIVLPLGAISSQIGASVSWDNLSTEPDGRLAVLWQRQNLMPNQRYSFGVTFPKEYVQAYVGADRVHNLNTGLNYTSIQEAINANETLNRHTILVDAGVYDESIIVNKSISLIGENRTDTLFNTPEYFWGSAINITSADVEIASFSFPPTFLTKIWVGSCSNVTIRNNIIQSSRQCIVLNGTNNCTIKGNVVSGLGLEENDLIVLYGGSECVIEDNSILNACYDGIGLYSSSNNLIRNNLISHNQYGIEFFGTNTGNIIFHNNFVDNPFQVSGVAGSNTWDNGLEGNYWSDYNGSDMNQDGIGDTPHLIDIDDTDNYPLMGTFSEFSVAPQYTVQTICNSTISNFQSNDTAISFDASGENGTFGFCRICIPTTLMDAVYKVYVNGTEVLHTVLSDSNSTHSYLYFSYAHSTQEVVIISEFPLIPVVALLMSVTLLVVTFCRRRSQPKSYFLFLNSFTPSRSQTKSKPCSTSFAASSTVFADGLAQHLEVCLLVDLLQLLRRIICVVASKY